MTHDIDTLIRRSRERSDELSRRTPTRAEIRWGTRIALGGVPENDLSPAGWRSLAACIHRFGTIRYRVFNRES